MSEPLRMRDPGSGASVAARALLAAAEAPSALPSATRERVRSKLARSGAGAEARAVGGAVCRSHALGFTLALATGCACVLFSQHARQEPERGGVAASAITRGASAHGVTPARVRTHAAAEAVAVAEPPAREVAAEAVAVAEPPAREVAAGLARDVAARAERAREVAVRASPVRIAVADGGRRASPRVVGHAARAPGRAERSRKRIEAVVEEVLSPDALLLERAQREVEHAPLVALGLIEGYRRRHPESALPAPAALVEVDALRRLGRFDDALARARALVGRKNDYADEMANRFAMLDL